MTLLGRGQDSPLCVGVHRIAVSYQDGSREGSTVAPEANYATPEE